MDRKVKDNVLSAVEKLITKYSNEMVDDFMTLLCPLCAACDNYKAKIYCIDCPNNYFKGERFGCINRSNTYPELDWSEEANYPKLKSFWTKFMDAANEDKTSDECIEYALNNYHDS